MARSETEAGDRIVIRLASIEDCDELRALAALTFEEAFAHDNDPSDFAAYLAEAFSLEAVRAELNDANNTFFLLSTEPEAPPVGYAKLRDGAIDPSVRGRRPIELHRLYLRSSTIGSGHGARLMRACVEKARADGFETLWLGVWEKNPRAIDFYLKWGFEQVGSHRFQLGSDDQTDLIFERPTASRTEPLSRA